jgi:hypothetical protein
LPCSGHFLRAQFAIAVLIESHPNFIAPWPLAFAS